MIVKERPILFSGEMVRAILDGRKTQTRRIVKDQAIGERYSHALHDGRVQLEWLGTPACGTGVWNVPEHSAQVTSPYGLIGDRLWVRESFWGCDGAGMGDTPCVVYDDEWEGKDYHAAEIRPWAPRFGRIPSIHMPRSCSRITLEVTGVRVEQLQDISTEDCIAEGNSTALREHDAYVALRDGYRALWDSLNAARGHGWDTNPWVWVVEFKRLESSVRNGE